MSWERKYISANISEKSEQQEKFNLDIQYNTGENQIIWIKTIYIYWIEFILYRIEFILWDSRNLKNISIF